MDNDKPLRYTVSDMMLVAALIGVHLGVLKLVPSYWLEEPSKVYGVAMLALIFALAAAYLALRISTERGFCLWKRALALLIVDLCITGLPLSAALLL
ncbi:MAG TPA: hypothetical protein VEJ63_23255 [Planctomycetota bacterium]|nr:hypothetical protein [Planctomycetota bacterium]